MPPLFCIALALLCLSQMLQAAGSGGVNAPEMRDRPTLILVSIDGFRWDYQDLYHTPTFDRFAAEGIRAEALIPVFPTLTFPNHYSIATGLYPAHHGIIGNRFPSLDRTRYYSLYDRESVQDGDWYGGVPVWLAAENSGMVTAAFYFVGTEAPVGGVPMTYWKSFDKDITGSQRVAQVLEWLKMDEEKRPHLVTLYFEDVDTATHEHGPGSAQSIESIQRVDGYLDQLLSGVADLPIADEISIILVSDHGQSDIMEAEPFILDSVVDLEGITEIGHGAVSFLYLADDELARATAIRDAINGAWEHGKAMLRAETPPEWKMADSAAFADLILVSDPGYLVFSTADKAQYASPGDHGWAPEFPDMHGFFLATGPRLPRGLTIPAISVTDVYPLMMDILQLPITTPIDGDATRLLPLLKPVE